MFNRLHLTTAARITYEAFWAGHFKLGTLDLDTIQAAAAVLTLSAGVLPSGSPATRNGSLCVSRDIEAVITPHYLATGRDTPWRTALGSSGLMSPGSE